MSRSAEKKYDSSERQEPSDEMEKSVLGVLALKFANRVGETSLGTAVQVMPAENLVKHDPVKKASQAQSEGDAGLCYVSGFTEEDVGQEARRLPCEDQPLIMPPPFGWST